MATKSNKPKELLISEMSMSDLVTLHCRCEAVFAEGMFGWTIDRKIDKIGKNAKQAVEYKIGEELTMNRARRKAIEEEVKKPFLALDWDETTDVALQAALRKEKEYMTLIEKESKLWDITIPDFEFVPVSVKITNETTKKLKKDERQVTFRERVYSVEVYAALGFLVDKGYLIETT